MAALLRKYGLFYLAHATTFFFLCAYSLATNAPNYPFLPAIFFPIYLSSAVALSEHNAGDPLLGILPLTPGEVMKVKFLLAFVFVIVGWLNMGLFTMLKGLEPQLTWQVMKLNTLGSIYSLLLAAAYQLGIHFFGWKIFQKILILGIVMFAIFDIAFFVGIAKSGHNPPGDFPLVPFLDSLPMLVLGVLTLAAVFVYNLALHRGSWKAA
jgi:hypothetical protein